MKLYLFERLSELTNCYHDSGGLVIIAKSKKAAEKLFNSKNIEWDAHVVFKNEWWDKLTLEKEVKCEEEKCFVFEDTGCC